MRPIHSHLLKASGKSLEHSSATCPDTFGIFGFLSFLLAIVDLALKFHGMAMPSVERKKRGVISLDNGMECSDEYRVAGESAALLLIGFIDALNNNDIVCSQRRFCEGAKQAASLGPLGKVMAQLGSVNAHSWLMKINSTRFDGLAEAGRNGASEEFKCAALYSQCTRGNSYYKTRKEIKNTSFLQDMFESAMNEYE